MRVNQVSMIASSAMLFVSALLLSVSAHAFTNNKEAMTTNANECVLLLHGLARSPRSMRRMEKILRKEGYNVINFTYPSRQHDVETLASTFMPEAIAQCPQGHTIHIVTHSLGGILTRYYLNENTIENLGRVVMLAPPNKGSEIVDTLGHLKSFKMVNGPAGLQLGTDANSIVNQLPPVDFELGVIAGNKSPNALYSSWINGKNDGKVSVESTKVDGMSDHIEMEVTHPYMMRNKKVINQVIAFLQRGTFTTEKE